MYSKKNTDCLIIIKNEVEKTRKGWRKTKKRLIKYKKKNKKNFD